MIYHKEQSQRNKNKKKKRQHSGMSSHCMLKRLRDDCRSGNVDLNHPFQRAVTLHCSQVLAGSFSFPFFLSLRLQLLPSSLTCLVFKWGNLCRPPARLLALGRCRALHGPKRSGALSSWERTGTKGEKGCCFAQGTYLVRVYTYLKQLKRERGWERGGGVQVCLIGLKCQINQQKIKE